MSNSYKDKQKVTDAPVVKAVIIGGKTQIVDAQGNIITPSSTLVQTDGSQKTQVVDSLGRTTNLQVSVFGLVTNLTTADFTSETPFLIKNDNEETVTLEVWPAEGSGWVSTNFQVGWNPEVVIAIKTTATGGNLVWGY